MTSSPKFLMTRLSFMMFLQFFIWGAWFEIGFSYIPALKFAEGWMYSLVFGAFNIGALVALFFSTQFADRKFAAEKFLAVSHLIGGLAILGLFFLQTKVGTNVGEFSHAKLTGKSSLSDGVGEASDGRKVTLKNIVKPDEHDDAKVTDTTEYKERLARFVEAKPEERAEKKLGEKLGAASKYWALFEHDLKTYEKASEEERKEKKLSDPRGLKTFTVTEVKDKELIGDVTTPLAPFWPFFALMLVHSIFYLPTISITNSIAFNAFTNPEKQFGPVRLWGTIGWIVASWPFIFILVDWAAVKASGKSGLDMIGAALGTPLAGSAEIEGQRYVFLVAGAASLLLAMFSLCLPHTPPKPASGEDSLAWLKALKFLMKPFLLILFIVTFIDAAVHQSYFFWTFDYLKNSVGIPANWAGPTMKIGQIAEVVTMLALGWVLKTLGWRWTMVIGVLGHAARFSVFAYMPYQTPVIAVILLHGVCYAFFFATVYIFVDKYFPKDIRSSAQGLFNVLILGIGPFAANFACGELKGKYTTNGVLNYTNVFEYSMCAALIGAILLAVLFHPPKEEAKG